MVPGLGPLRRPHLRDDRESHGPGLRAGRRYDTGSDRANRMGRPGGDPGPRWIRAVRFQDRHQAARPLSDAPRALSGRSRPAARGSIRSRGPGGAAHRVGKGHRQGDGKHLPARDARDLAESTAVAIRPGHAGCREHRSLPPKDRGPGTGPCPLTGTVEGERRKGEEFSRA